jgi:hypothetical protein
MLLPWHVNGTLEAPELALLEAHLAECPECRADLAAEMALRAGFASMPMPDVAEAKGVRALQANARPRASTRHRFLARRVAVGWALAPAAAAAAAVALFVLLPPAARGPDPAYRLLGSGDSAAAGNMIVMFAPETTERQLRSALEQAGGRLVDGPTASGAYIVRVAPEERPAALARLQTLDEVVLAQPIDAGAAP